MSKRWIIPSVVLAALALLAAVTASLTLTCTASQRSARASGAGSPAQESHPVAEGLRPAQAEPLGTSFTYQGQLNLDGQAVDSTCAFQFALYEDGQGGNQVGTTQTITGVQVAGGLFTVRLNFGAPAFAGDARWLRIQVRCTGDAGYADLGLQELTATPYALYALGAPWDGLTGVPPGFADGVDDVAAVVSGTAIYAGEGLNQIGSGGAVTMSIAPTYRLPQACASGQITEWDGAEWLCGDDDVGSGGEGDITAVRADYGLGGGGESGDVTLSVVTNTIQSRVSESCLPGSSVRVIHADGTVECEEDDIGSGDGGGDITAVLPGEGLTGGALSGTATLTVAFSGSGVAATAARADHDHDGVYSPVGHTHPGSDITSPVAEAVSATWATTATYASAAGDADTLDGQHGAYYLDWGNLSNVPPGFADGVDDVDDADADPANELNQGLALLSDTLVITDAGGALSVDLSVYRQPVSGTCAVGSTIRAINADGSVICQSDAPLHRASPPTANTLTTLDSAGHVGLYTSITIGANGLPFISYRDNTNADLKLARCDDVACTSATLVTLDGNWSSGAFTSIAIGADGHPIISYYGGSNLKVAHCIDAICSGVTIATLDSVGDVGRYTAITIGADGLPVISYRDSTNQRLKVAHCNDAACSSAALNAPDNTGNVGEYTSIAIGADGLPVISYYDYTNESLKVAHCNDLLCASATLSTLDGAGTVGFDTWITVGADGLPIVSYYDYTNEDLKVAHCNDVACTSATISTLDSAGDVGEYTSITIGADGLAVISYRDDTNDDLKVAHCNDIACTSATLTAPDSAGYVGWYTSVSIGVDGLPIISHYDDTNDDLRLVHCANPFCVPYWRRR